MAEAIAYSLEAINRFEDNEDPYKGTVELTIKRHCLISPDYATTKVIKDLEFPFANLEDELEDAVDEVKIGLGKTWKEVAKLRVEEKKAEKEKAEENKSVADLKREASSVTTVTNIKKP